MNINHGRLVLRSFPALDGLSPLHRPYRPPHDHIPFLPFLNPLPSASSVLYRRENWPTPPFYLRAHTPPRSQTPLPGSGVAARGVKAPAHYSPTPVRVHVSLARTPRRRCNLFLPFPFTHSRDISTAELANASTLILDMAIACQVTRT